MKQQNKDKEILDEFDELVLGETIPSEVDGYPIEVFDDEQKKRIKQFISKALQQVREEERREGIKFGRISVLKDFDNLCSADAFIGFTDEEFKTIKRFFEMNKKISGWDKL